MVGNLFSFLIQQLLSIIKTLQAKVTDEAMKKAMMELRIREEVAQEMNEQIAEIENMYRFVYDIITIAGKSILKWVKLQSLVAKYFFHFTTFSNQSLQFYSF